MSREFQVTVDAHSPRRLAAFWKEALGYEYPPPPGMTLADGEDPLAAWDRFLADAGVATEEHSGTSLYFRDPDGARVELIADPLGEMYGNQVL